MGTFNLGNKSVTETFFQAINNNQNFPGTELVCFQRVNKRAHSLILSLSGEWHKFPDNSPATIDAVVAWKATEWRRNGMKMPNQEIRSWTNHPIFLPGEIQEAHFPSNLNERLVAVHLESVACSAVGIVMASLHLRLSRSDTEEEKIKYINSIINYFSFYALEENVQAIIGCSLGFSMKRVLPELTEANRRALEENGVKVG